MGGSGLNTGPNYAPTGSKNLIDSGEISNDEYGQFLQSSAGSAYNKSDFTISTQQFLSHDDQMKVLGTNYGTTSAVDAYRAWKASKEADDAAHDQYVKLATQDSPGRSSTILTQPGTTKPVTLIGG